MKLLYILKSVCISAQTDLKKKKTPGVFFFLSIFRFPRARIMYIRKGNFSLMARMHRSIQAFSCLLMSEDIFSRHAYYVFVVKKLFQNYHQYPPYPKLCLNVDCLTPLRMIQRSEKCVEMARLRQKFMAFPPQSNLMISFYQLKTQCYQILVIGHFLGQLHDKCTVGFGRGILENNSHMILDFEK